MIDDDIKTGGAGTAAAAISRGEAPETEGEELIRRRRFLQAGIGVGIALTVGGISILSVTSSLRPAPTVTPETEPPAPGDKLVFAEDQSHVVVPDDLQLAAAPKTVYAMDPASKVVKSGTDNNLALVSRFDPSSLSADTKPHAAAGVVAYSAICTHLCCMVSLWDAQHQWLHCPCHHAEYDPRNGAKVMAGPAPRALPVLPLKIADGQLTVAAGFLTLVGCNS